MKLRLPRFYHQSAHHKRMLVRQAKSQPCVDCLAEGRRADWPWPAMTLDHTGHKTMEFWSGTDGDKRSLRKPRYLQFTVSEILRELATCEPVCASHHNIRTRVRLLAIGPDDDEDDEGEDDEGEIALF